MNQRVRRVVETVLGRYHGKSPTVAIAIEDGRRWRAYTSQPCHPRGLVHSHHAEQRACCGAKTVKLLLVIRISGDGSLANAKPCKLCCEVLREKCKRVLCSDDSGKIVPADLHSQYVTSGTRWRMKQNDARRKKRR